MTGYPWNVGDALLAEDLNDAIANAGALAEGVVSVAGFGAKGDGVTDDTAAINAALNSIRAKFPFGNGRMPFRLVFPPGRYVVTAPLNFTRLDGLSGGVVDGCGSEIWVKHTGVGLDCLGSKWLKFRDLSIFGDATMIPRFGIQIGRVNNSESSDYHSFYNFNVWGSFSLACYYNRSSETCSHYSSSYRNDQLGANKFCMILDGLNHWGVTSTFVTLSGTADTPESFNENLFSSCSWQGAGNNGVVWIGNTARHKFDSCYASCAIGWIFSVYAFSAGVAASVFLDLNCHCEQIGLQNAIVFTGPIGITYAYVIGFSYADHGCAAAISALGIDPASAIANAEIRWGRFRIGRMGGVSPTLVDVPSKWQINADDAVLSSGMWSNATANWTGAVKDATDPYQSFDVARKWGSTARPTVMAGAYGFASDTNQHEWFDNVQGWHSFLSDKGGTASGMVTFNSGITFSGGTNAVGTIYTDSGWGCLIKGRAGSQADVALQASSGTIGVKVNTLGVGFQGTAGIAKPTVSGAKGGNAALTSLLAALVAYGLITDGSS